MVARVSEVVAKATKTEHEHTNSLAFYVLFSPSIFERLEVDGRKTLSFFLTLLVCLLLHERSLAPEAQTDIVKHSKTTVKETLQVFSDWFQ